MREKEKGRGEDSSSRFWTKRQSNYFRIASPGTHTSSPNRPLVSDRIHLWFTPCYALHTNLTTSRYSYFWLLARRLCARVTCFFKVAPLTRTAFGERLVSDAPYFANANDSAKANDHENRDRQSVAAPEKLATARWRSLNLTPFWRCCIFCCCLLLLVGCQSHPASEGLTVQVQRVVSGQTLDVLNPMQQPALLERVRLIGIEAPDLKQQPWGATAKNSFEQMLSKTIDQQLVLQPVFLEPDVQEKDSSGRWLAYVWYDGVLLNEQLVKNGYVLAAPRAPNNKYDSRLARAQEYARIMGYGIWNPKQPMRLTPAEFRRQNP